MSRKLFTRSATVLAVVSMLSACASFSPDGGMNLVAAKVDDDMGAAAIKLSTEAEESNAVATVDELLTRTLSAETAVQVALANNRGLQAEYNALGVSEAAYVAASLPENPTVSLGKLVTGDAFEVETRLVASLLSLFTLRARTEIAVVEFEAAQYRAIEATFRLAHETRRAFYEAIAARQTVAFLLTAQQSAAAAAEFTTKLGETGAATKIEQARASTFYLEVSNDLAEARIAAEVARERLVRALGVWGDDVNFKLPSALPPIPDALPKSESVEATAINKRVDLAVARLELDALERTLGLTDATRFTSMLDLAGLANYEREGVAPDDVQERRWYGLELEFTIPIFDNGSAEVRKAEQTYTQAINRLAELAVNIRSQVRAAYQTYRATYEISWQFRNRILPMRDVITEQSLLEYNGMLTDVFDLLTTAAENVDSNVAAIVAKRDFFLAAVDFQAALLGGGAGGAPGFEGASSSNPAGSAEH